MAEPSPGHGPGVHLELGCGAAGRAVLPGCSLAVGLDLEVGDLGQARQESTGWTFIGADVRSLPVRSGSCDFLSLQMLLHHLDPIGPALGELARVLRPDGMLNIVDGIALEAGKATALQRELDRNGLPGEPYYGLDLEELGALVAANGLKIEDLTIDGVATFASPPLVSRAYTSPRFALTARRL